VAEAGFVYVDDPSLSRIAERIEPFAGPMHQRSDGALVSATFAVVAMPNTMARPELARYASVVQIREATSEDELLERTMDVFRLLLAHGDAAVLVSVGGATVSRFEPRVTASPR
jgi:hypothetical protein